MGDDEENEFNISQSINNKQIKNTLSTILKTNTNGSINTSY